MQSIYCTYLTTYFGSKLPMFYIGSTSIQKINSNYHGSVSSKKYKSIWKKELKDNPHLFKTKIISKHNTDSEARLKEFELQKKLNVVKSSMYINQSLASINGFFGTDVNGILNPFSGKHHSDHQKEVWSKLRKGMPSKNKGIPMTETQKLKLKKPKSQNHINALKKPKSNSTNMGKYERTLDWKIKNSERIKAKPKFECIHCNKIIDNLNYKRWHGDNCKIKI